MKAAYKLTPVVPVPSDIDISNAAKPLPITEIAADLKLAWDEYDMYGPVKAKINSVKVLRRVEGQPSATYVVVTALTPTAFGEGKSTTTIGLTQAIGSYLNLPVAACVRQASMGPTFGVKGGAAGGGYSQAIPMPEFNLHLTGDIHAITAANNLMCTALDTAIFHETTQPVASLFRRMTTDGSGNRCFAPQHIHRLKRRGLMPADATELPDPTTFDDAAQRKFAILDVDQDTISVHRCVDMNDRMLRTVKTGEGAEEVGKPAARHERFEISVASEVMGVLALASDLKDLRARLGRIVVARSRAGENITCDDLGVAGSMGVLLKDAVDPNLMQSLEGNPILVHCGPFGNIAHGNSSIIADRLALPLVGEGGFVLTEAGFGADMGLEKFVNIKCRVSGLTPAVAVVVATIRAVKAHDPQEQNDLTRGFANLGRHIKNVVAFGMRAVVVINRFHTDTDDEIATVKALSDEAGAFRAVVSNHWAQGGAGAVDAAQAVVDASKEPPQALQFTYDDSASIADKMRAVVTKVYGGDGIHLADGVEAKIAALERSGFGHLPICMAKTQYSFSHDPKLKGAPTGFTVPIMDVFVNAGPPCCVSRCAVPCCVCCAVACCIAVPHSSCAVVHRLLTLFSLSPTSGAGFIVAMCGPISRMPGLTTRPAYLQIDITPDGDIIGLS